MQTVKCLTDAELLIALSQGRQTAFRSIYQRYWKGLYQTAYAYFRNQEDAEDAIHDVFVHIWERRASLKVDISLAGYLQRALKNRIIRVLSRSELHQRAMDHLVDRLTEIQVTVFDAIAVSDLEDTLSKAIDQFPDNMKKIFVLRHEDYTVKEIATALGLADQTVRNNLAEAIRRLRSTLAKKHPELTVTVTAYIINLLNRP